MLTRKIWQLLWSPNLNYTSEQTTTTNYIRFCRTSTKKGYTDWRILY